MVSQVTSLTATGNGFPSVESISKVLDISPNCTVNFYTSNNNLTLFEGAKDVLEYAKSMDVMVGTVTMEALDFNDFELLNSMGVSLYQCNRATNPPLVRTITLRVKLEGGIATLYSNGMYGTRYTGTITQENGHIYIKDVKGINSKRVFPDAIIPEFAREIPYTVTAVGDIVSDCKYSEDVDNRIDITLTEGATDGVIKVKFVWGI